LIRQCLGHLRVKILFDQSIAQKNVDYVYSLS
jgi:hypothetical protein